MRNTSAIMRNGRLPSISVVIPARNEEANIGVCIASVIGRHTKEVIVCDGGSTDGTVAIARALGAEVIIAPRGRARQMNAGANAATGEILLFLHADCVLAPSALPRLRRLMALGKHQAGYFRQRIDGRHPLYRLIELGSNQRARWLGRPYGDQAMFFRRAAFDEIGGFPDVPIMEDLGIARAARRLGPLLPMPETVTSSARRWKADGIIRRILRNWSVAVAERRGEPLGSLVSRYANGRDKPPASSDGTGVP